ncbi:MAG: hypothetical protein IJ689_05065 [Alphaproteobacteria bacterium]|nr:hypothetical protein [Alphaproteobacteria bacterium]
MTDDKQTVPSFSPYRVLPMRAFRLVCLSFGFYPLFWFYKNRRMDKKLFSKINLLFQTIVILLYISGVIAFPFLKIPVWIFFIMIIVEGVLLGCLQKSVNAALVCQGTSSHLQKKLSAGELKSIIFGMLIVLGSFTGKYFDYFQQYKNILALNEPQNFITAMTFKHLSAYPFVCEQNGYVMHNYQNEFNRIFAVEMTRYEKALQSKELTMIRAWDNQTPEALQFIITMVIVELRGLKEELQTASQKEISFYDACKFLDDTAEQIFSASLKDKITAKINRL